jgi:hypothetical protein
VPTETVVAGWPCCAYTEVGHRQTKIIAQSDWRIISSQRRTLP